MQLCDSLNILWHCLSLGLEWKLRNEITRGLSVDGTVLNVSWAKKAACFRLATFSCRRTSARGQSWFDQQVRWPCPRYSEAGEKRRWSQSEGGRPRRGQRSERSPGNRLHPSPETTLARLLLSMWALMAAVPRAFVSVQNTENPYYILFPRSFIKAALTCQVMSVYLIPLL